MVCPRLSKHYGWVGRGIFTDSEAFKWTALAHCASNKVKSRMSEGLFFPPGWVPGVISSKGNTGSFLPRVFALRSNFLTFSRASKVVRYHFSVSGSCRITIYSVLFAYPAKDNATWALKTAIRFTYNIYWYTKYYEEKQYTLNINISK